MTRSNFVQYLPTGFAGNLWICNTRIYASTKSSDFQYAFLVLPISTSLKPKHALAIRPICHSETKLEAARDQHFVFQSLSHRRKFRRWHSIIKHSFRRLGIQHHGRRSPLYSLQGGQPLKEALTMAMHAFLTMIHHLSNPPLYSPNT